MGHTVADRVSKLFRVRDESMNVSEISTTLVSRGWISGFEVRTLDVFKEEANDLVQSAQKRGNKYL